MRSFESMGLKLVDGRLWVLDQTLLPDQESWIEVNEAKDMADLILDLKIRGAPLLGVGAAVTLGRLAERGANRKEFEAAAQLLAHARPTAVNLKAAVDRVVAAADPAREADAIVEEDRALAEAISDHGARLFEDGDRILTHCNTGGLVSAGIGTALGAIRRAFEQKKRIHVIVDETRPLLQGARLTAWELERLGIPYTLQCDNMAAMQMARGRISKVITGADRIARNGDSANKIGTYGVAVHAHHHRIPFYIAAPMTTVDAACPSGAEIPIEERRPDEVRGAGGAFGKVRFSPEAAPVHNPAFDVTPAALITALVLDIGVIHPTELESRLGARR